MRSSILDTLLDRNEDPSAIGESFWKRLFLRMKERVLRPVTETGKDPRSQSRGVLSGHHFAIASYLIERSEYPFRMPAG